MDEGRMRKQVLYSWYCLYAVIVIYCIAFGLSEEVRASALNNILSALIPVAIIALYLGPDLLRVRKYAYRLYFHPSPLHVPRKDCDARCNTGLSPLELLALQAEEPAKDDLLPFWWISYDLEDPTPHRRYRRK